MPAWHVSTVDTRYIARDTILSLMHSENAKLNISKPYTNITRPNKTHSTNTYRHYSTQFPFSEVWTRICSCPYALWALRKKHNECNHHKVTHIWEKHCISTDVRVLIHTHIHTCIQSVLAPYKKIPLEIQGVRQNFLDWPYGMLTRNKTAVHW